MTIAADRSKSGGVTFDSRRRRGVVLEAGVLGVGVVLALVLHQLVSAVGVLTWAVLLGAVLGNAVPHATWARSGLVSKKLLRLGIVLLGFSLSFGAVVSLGPALFAVVAGCLFATFGVTYLVGMRFGLPRSRSVLVAAGFSICGASAIVAMGETVDADEDDVASAIALVTLFGSALMVLMPLSQGALGLTDLQLGVWAGASVHEVGQVVAAAGPAGTAAVSIAVVVKLTRVLLLAPIVMGGQWARRRRRHAADAAGSIGTPPIVPLFIVGFVACALVRTTGVLPEGVLSVTAHVQTVALGAALFGLGMSVQVARMAASGGRALAVGAISTLFISTAALLGVLLVV